MYFITHALLINLNDKHNLQAIDTQYILIKHVLKHIIYLIFLTDLLFTVTWPKFNRNVVSIVLDRVKLI